MRYLFIVLLMLFGSAMPLTSAIAQVNIGIHLSLFPELVRVPNYPVYYAPRLRSNFFFYDGYYWVYQGDNWYVSDWYNGPWEWVAPEVVPLFVLRIPVRYYRNPPVYFRHWRSDAPPRWGDHWGRDWEQHRHGWDRWNRNAAPKPAPLPVYQRKYSGDRYPHVEKQQELRSQNYRYQPREVVRPPSVQERAVQGAPRERDSREQRGPDRDRDRDKQRSAPPPTFERGAAVPQVQSPDKAREDRQRAAPSQAAPRPSPPAVQEQRPQRQPAAVQQERQAPVSREENVQRGKGASQERGRAQEQEKEREKDDERRRERGQDRNR